MSKSLNEQYFEIISLLDECGVHIEKISIGSFKDAELLRKIESKLAELHIERRRLQKCDD